MANGSAVLIGQLTDTHVVEPDTDERLYVDNNQRLATAVSMLNAESPTLDAVLATGDLVNWGRADEYEALVELLAPLDAPLLPIPGNHDDRDRIRASFPDMPWADASHASWVHHIDGVRIIGLDSTIPEASGAAFDDARDEWLRRVLAPTGDTLPTILAMHHPPFVTGIGWMDKSGFEGLDRLAATLADSQLDRVDRIVCGHFHRPMTAAIAGVTAQVGLSTVQHVDLDLAPEAPIKLVLDPPGYQIHHISGAGTASSPPGSEAEFCMVSHTRYLETGHDGFIPYWADSHTP